MPITYINAPYSDAAVMQFSQLASDFAAARDWINAIPGTDLDSDRVVKREHLVRPAFPGFPEQMVISDFQGAFYRSFGASDGTVLQNTEWGSRRNRITIPPYATGSDTGKELWHTPISATFYLRANWFVEAHAVFEIQVRSDGSAAIYPDGASGANTKRGGIFRFHLHNRQNGTTAEYEPGQQHVYPMESSVLNHDTVHISFADELSAGHYDLQVVYHRGGATNDQHQIDMGRVALFGRMS